MLFNKVIPMFEWVTIQKTSASQDLLLFGSHTNVFRQSYFATVILM